MEKLVILKLDGDWEQQGFRVDLTISKQVEEPRINSRLNPLREMTRYLPANPELASLLHQHWQEKYRHLGAPYRLEAGNIQYDGSVNNLIDECKQSAFQVSSNMNNWLKSEQFCKLKEQLLLDLSPNETIRFLIRTKDELLQKLPWQEWDLIKGFPKAEFGLAPYDWGEIPAIKNRSHKMKILAILGHSEGIDIEADRKLLENLPNAEVTFLVEPNRQNINDQLWEQAWDIIFFAGHSRTEGETGRIYINPNYSLTISELWYALRKAVERGLQLAIFNSCDGLGLTRELDDDLHLPQMIVMRELVPDKVAQTFLKYFLTAFSNGQPFHLAVSDARQQLQGLEDRFPCATWLPVIYQNPTAVPPNWKPPPKNLLRRLGTALLTSVAVTGLVMGVRWSGALQNVELKALDHLMHMRPSESADKKLLIIGVDEKDIRKYSESSSVYGNPIPDKVLAQLFDKLQEYGASAIGLDIVRDKPVPKNDTDGHKKLVQHFQKNEKLITICSFNRPTNSTLENSIAPPPKSLEEQQGFVDVFDDKSQTGNRDETVRRYLLSRGKNAISRPSRCNTPYSFAWQLAYLYLDAEEIPITIVGDNWKFDTTTFKRLKSRSAGYQNLDNRGNQMLINYRNLAKYYNHIAQQVTLRDVLNNNENRFDPKWVKDRVVLVGVVAPSIKDDHYTPYGKMRGLYIQAHAVSQILSAVKEGRPMLWYFPQWGDGLWVLFWSFTSTIIIWFVPKPRYRWIILCFSSITLYGIYWGIFAVSGGWMPLIPSALALILVGVGVPIYTKYANKGQ